MTNLTYERANILDIISHEDVKIMQKLKKIKKSAEEDYKVICQSFTFKFNQQWIEYQIIVDEKYCGVVIYHGGKLIFVRKDGHSDICTIQSEDDIYNYYKAQYLLSKKILPNDEDVKEKFMGYAYFGAAIRKIVHLISDGKFKLVE